MKKLILFIFLFSMNYGCDFVETKNLIDIIYNPEETILMKRYKEKDNKKRNWNKRKMR